MKTGLLEHNQNYINRWIVSYADFVTMLLALFMVMYALSQLDLSNMKTFSKSINKAFDKKLIQINNSIDTNNKAELLKLFKTTQTKIYTDKENSHAIDSASKELKKKLSSYENKITIDSDNFENIRQAITNQVGNDKNINIIREPRGLLIRLNNTVLFDKGSDIIKDKALRILDKIAIALKNEPNSIKIEGHTDNIPIKTSKFPSNWELSTARATNIIKYLVNAHKINPAKVSAVGYGEYMPISNNNTSEGQSQNRRVDIIVLSSSSKIFEPAAYKVINQ